MRDVRAGVIPSARSIAPPPGDGFGWSVLSALAAAMFFATAADAMALVLHVTGVMPLLP